MSAARVVVTDSNLPSDAHERVLRDAGLDVVVLDCRTAEDVVGGVAGSGAEALLVQWAPVTAAALDAAPSCRFVSRLGIGYDMIDVDAATARGVAVANTPDYCVEEVAAHTIAMIMWLVRSLGALDRELREGRWDATAVSPPALRPSRRTVGVVGLGRIGRLVAVQAVALGFEVVASDPFAPAPDGVRQVALGELLAGSDVVTLHAPLTAGTRRLIRTETLATMRPGAYLVNTCRGGLVDEAALVDALRSGRLGGAALDVFEHEPLADADPLRSLPNVLLTPHAAWYSPASLGDLPVRTAQQVVDFFAGRPVPSIVNPAYAERVRGRAAV